MSRDFVVRLRFQPIQGLAKLQRVVGLAKLTHDEPGHPFGQWSVIADLWSVPDEHGIAHASLDFASPHAPKAKILQGDTFPLFVGPNLIADVDVLMTPRRESATYDDDFFVNRRTRARHPAAAKSPPHDARL
jgi:hypothetical protein